MKNQNGFTMIELVVVIVVLGILAAVAIPKYVDMKEDAADAQAQGVFGAAQSAAALNFAGNLLGKGLTLVTDGTSLLGAMDGTPTDWAVSGTDTDCIENSSHGGTYQICVDTAEDADSKAVLSLSES